MTLTKYISLYSRQLLAILFLGSCVLGQAQERQLIDKVIAKIGSESVLLSDIESQYAFAAEQSGAQGLEVKCNILQSMIGQKLIVMQARLDSVEVAPQELEANLEFRIDQVLGQMNGDEQFFQEYYGMTVNQMRENLREDLEQQMLADRMKSKIINEVRITPKEVKEFFSSIPADSLPYLNAEVELAEIVVKPQVSEVERTKALKKIVELRQRIVEQGEDFAELAGIYSDDPGSARNGGDLGFAERGTFVPEFEAAAYSLEKDEISEPVETEYGFHLMQLMERRGNKINLRHILVKPAINQEDHEKAVQLLDTIKTQIENGELTFAQAVKDHSDEKIPSYNNNGQLQNPNSGKTTFETSEIPFNIYIAIEDLEVGELTDPLEYKVPTGEAYHRIIKLNSRSKPHKMNLDEDYSKLQDFAKESKKSIYFSQWLEDKFENTFVSVERDYIQCPELFTLLDK